MITRYEELLDEVYNHHFEGIEYIFNREQLDEYLKRNGYTQADLDSGKLVSDGQSGIGTKEMFRNRYKFLIKWAERVKKECTPDEIYTYEWWNHECGYTGDYMAALAITRDYFPDYEIPAGLNGKLQEEFNKIN